MIPVPGVYVIRHCRTGATYVGASKNIARRWQSHQSDLDAGRHSNRALQAAWNEDGKAAFTVSLVEPVAPDVDRLRRAEQRWLEQLRRAGATLFSELNAQSPRRALNLIQTADSSLPAQPTVPGLKRLRLFAALSQRELARRAGVSPTTIGRIEDGEQAHPSTVRKLADALGCQPRDLIEPEK